MNFDSGCSQFIYFPLFQCSPDLLAVTLHCVLVLTIAFFKSKYCWWSQKKIQDSEMHSASLHIQCYKHWKQYLCSQVLKVLASGSCTQPLQSRGFVRLQLALLSAAHTRALTYSCMWACHWGGLPETHTFLGRTCSLFIPGHLDICFSSFIYLLSPSTWCQLAPTFCLCLWSKNCDIFPTCMAGHLTTRCCFLRGRRWSWRHLSPHWSALQQLSLGKTAPRESFSKSICLSALEHHLSTLCLTQNSNEALKNSGICKLVHLWRIQAFESEFSFSEGCLQLMGSDHSLLQKGDSLCLNGLAAIHILLLALQLQISIT